MTKKQHFVVQKHQATRLHYDFRLQMDNVLKSWAIPKGPSIDPSQKRLAIKVEDHPLSYRTFEGIIPPGSYGAGTVMVWDFGVYELLDMNLQTGRLKFYLEGKKLKGLFTLAETSYVAGGWLLIKVDDAFARRGSNITKEQPNSAKTGLALGEINE